VLAEILWREGAGPGSYGYPYHVHPGYISVPRISTTHSCERAKHPAGIAFARGNRTLRKCTAHPGAAEHELRGVGGGGWRAVALYM